MSALTTSSVLLVEDNPLDIQLTVELLGEARLANHLSVISDGRKAIDALTAAAAAGAGVPDLVLLDLSLPGADGREVLAAVRSIPALADVAVFVLTAGRAQRELVEEEGLAADGYLEKPIDLAQLLAGVTRHPRFWIELVSPPR